MTLPGRVGSGLRMELDALPPGLKPSIYIPEPSRGFENPLPRTKEAAEKFQKQPRGPSVLPPLKKKMVFPGVFLPLVPLQASEPPKYLHPTPQTCFFPSKTLFKVRGWHSLSWPGRSLAEGTIFGAAAYPITQGSLGITGRGRGVCGGAAQGQRNVDLG